MGPVGPEVGRMTLCTHPCTIFYCLFNFFITKRNNEIKKIDVLKLWGFFFFFFVVKKGLTYTSFECMPGKTELLSLTVFTFSFDPYFYPRLQKHFSPYLPKHTFYSELYQHWYISFQRASLFSYELLWVDLNSVWDPMDCSLPGSSIHGIFQARVLEWGAIAFSGFIYSHP